jgi:hypothetical protein
MGGQKVTVDGPVDVGFQFDGSGRAIGNGVVRPIQFDTGWIIVPGIVTASAYTALDAFGVPFEISGLPTSGRFETVLVQDEDKEEIASVLHLFNGRLLTPTADHDAMSVAIVDMDKQVGEIPITNADYSTSAISSFGTVSNIGLHFVAPGGRLTCQIKTLGTPTIASAKRTAVRFLGISTAENA